MGRLKHCKVALCAGLLVACGGKAEDLKNTGTGGTDGGQAAGGQPGNPALLPVGAPCVLSAEALPEYQGTASTEVVTEVGHATCASELCIANHFQGRVSCPYGQTQQDLALPSDDSRRCRTAEHVTGEVSDEPVERSVLPQDVGRRAHDVVTCSCRCAGSDPTAEYCSCPEGMECVPLIEGLGIDRGGLAGSYCIKEGTAYDLEGSTNGLTCDKDGTGPETDCGNGRQNP